MMRFLEITGEEVQYRVERLDYWMSGGRKASHGKILVNGSPKTGTTWMLYLLSSLPGYRNVGNFKGDILRYSKANAGDVIHGHEFYSAELKDVLESACIRVILMVRDPRDQAVSRMFHARRDSSSKWHAQLNEASDDEALLICIEGRPGLRGVVEANELTDSWLCGEEDCALWVKYEDMMSSPEASFLGVLRYLDIRAKEKFVRTIIARNRFERLTMGRRLWLQGRNPGQEDRSSHFRKGIVGDWRNYFKEEHKQRFKELAGSSLIKLGYESDDLW
jgi:hypothetical protein